MSDDTPLVPVCASADLVDGGAGVRFPVRTVMGDETGFVVRYRGVARAWLNRCAHMPVELDWNPGMFFDHSGLYLICATHGALYEPDTGRCAGGPCRKGRLRAIDVVEQAGRVYWRPGDAVMAPADVAPQQGGPGSAQRGSNNATPT